MPTAAPIIENEKQAVAAASSPRRGIKHIVLEAVIASAAAILILEILFTLAGVGEHEYLRVDKSLGFVAMENRHVTWRKEGFGRIQFNSQGMNDIERPFAKPANTFRIAIVGDSFVESLQVDRSQNFLSLLERDLNAKYGKSGRRIEVLNFGCSANSLGQFYKKIRTKVMGYEPDVVLIGVSVDATKLLAPLQGGFAFANARPTFLLDKQGKLVEDWQIFNWWNHSPDGKRFANTEFLRRHSHIWGAIGTMMGSYSAWCADLQAGKVWGWGSVNLGAAKSTAPALAKLATSPNTAGATSPNTAGATSQDTAGNARARAEKNAKYTGPVSAPFMEQSSSSVNAIPQAQGDVDAATRQYWPIADRLIRAMNEDCIAHHCRFAIVRLPARPEIGYDNPPETKNLEALSSQLKIPYCNLTPAFLNAPKQTALIFSVHMTAAGHQLTYKELEPFIERNKLAGN
ncbi:MAG: hypothetical protein KGS72_10730 [Cyanobacteria bacterium REEB67]|nr:hypothetical protein [Cyanobacteria bacterium REEB67]